VKLEVLHVTDCPNTTVLTARLAAVLSGRRDVVIEQREISDRAEARRRGMAGSPTLLIDGVDPFAMTGQAPSLSCRLYIDETGAVSGAPSLTQLLSVLANRGDR
jgi:hypothetical protein